MRCTRQRPWLRATAVAVAIAVVSGCTPKEGDSCSVGEDRCLDDRTKLSCQDGAYVASPCRGTDGCRAEGARIACDISGNAAGDPCALADEGQAACASDGTHALRCQEKRLVLEPCHGPRGCRPLESGPACDHAVAAVDQPCGPAARGRSACSLDGTAALICQDGTFVEEYPCRGPNGCRLSEGRPTCDRSIAVEGESCRRLPPGSKACSADGKALLACDGGTFKLFRPCSATKGCRASKKGKLYCDGT